jgi:hypothetical protein
VEKSSMCNDLGRMIQTMDLTLLINWKLPKVMFYSCNLYVFNFGLWGDNGNRIGFIMVDNRKIGYILSPELTNSCIGLWLCSVIL